MPYKRTTHTTGSTRTTRTVNSKTGYRPTTSISTKSGNLRTTQTFSPSGSTKLYTTYREPTTGYVTRKRIDNLKPYNATRAPKAKISKVSSVNTKGFSAVKSVKGPYVRKGRRYGYGSRRYSGNEDGGIQSLIAIGVGLVIIVLMFAIFK